MNYAERQPTMSAGEFREIRARLAEAGIEMAGDAQFHWRKVTGTHAPFVPHIAFTLDRVGDVYPTYEVAGYVECAMCKHLLFMERYHLEAIRDLDFLALCRTCQPAEIGSSADTGWQGFDLGEIPSAILSDFIRNRRGNRHDNG